MEVNNDHGDQTIDSNGCSTLLKEWINYKTLMKAVFHRKMKDIYNESVAKGVKFSTQDTGNVLYHHIAIESLILSICDEDILMEFKAYMKDVLAYALKNENQFLLKRTREVHFLPLSTLRFWFVT